MNRIIFKQKIRAFTLHLSLSILVAIISLYLVFYIWYPSPLASAVGVTRIFMLMLAIDVIFGPLLLSVIYQKNKKGLWYDIIFIISLQLMAFSYGLYNLYLGKPAWLVYDVDRFELVRINDIDSRELKKARPEYQEPPFFSPRYVASVIPSNDIDKANSMLFEEVMANITPAQRPELYQPLINVSQNIKKRALNLELLKQFNHSSNVDEVLEKYPNADAYLPLKATQKDMTVLINKKKPSSIIAIVNLRPW